MTNGLARFEVCLDRLEKLINEAAGQPDAALWLYQNNARTPIFMLEGLAKLYGGLHDKKLFGKIEEHFKLIEDGLGAIDYYDGFAKQFAKDATAAKGSAAFAHSKAAEKTKLLNDLLLKEQWIGKKADRLLKLRIKLREAAWLDEKPEIKAIESFYRKSIDKINGFAAGYQDGFTELETQVHELRRKLRWLSIYPQALRGCIQLTKTSSHDKTVEKYLTPDIVSSPFNQMPDAGSNRYLLMFYKDPFLSLSWLISELGRLKDVGLRDVLLNETGSAPDANGQAKILADATQVCRTYFAEKNLEKMLNGIVKNTD